MVYAKIVPKAIKKKKNDHQYVSKPHVCMNQMISKQVSK